MPILRRQLSDGLEVERKGEGKEKGKTGMNMKKIFNSDYCSWDFPFLLSTLYYFSHPTLVTVISMP
jgi:hypothetical protein